MVGVAPDANSIGARNVSMMASAVAAKSTVDPELVSVTQLLKSLDRASKNVRTFGHQNSVAKKFFEQFYTELTNHDLHAHR